MFLLRLFVHLQRVMHCTDREEGTKRLRQKPLEKSEDNANAAFITAKAFLNELWNGIWMRNRFAQTHSTAQHIGMMMTTLNVPSVSSNIAVFFFINILMIGWFVRTKPNGTTTY